MSESNSNTEVLKTAMESEKADFEQQMETLRALNSELNTRVEKSEQDKLTLTSTITVSPVSLLQYRARVISFDQNRGGGGGCAHPKKTSRYTKIGKLALVFFGF